MVSVTDTGIGLTEDEINKIYEPFQRLGFMGSAIEGSGIGLTVTKKLIENMGGEIGVKSEKGVGSTFWFTLSKSRNPVLISNNESAAVTVSKNDECNYDNKRNGKNKILYIEDNKTNLKLVESILSRNQMAVLMTAETAEDGLALIENEMPDIILMDINLPGISGLEALKILRDNEKTKHLPVIAVSANAMIDDIAAALDAGFNEYIEKPIDVERFNRTINKYCLNYEDEVSELIVNQ